MMKKERKRRRTTSRINGMRVVMRTLFGSNSTESKNVKRVQAQVKMRRAFQWVTMPARMRAAEHVTAAVVV
jgi:hypothetical protein